MQGSAGKLTVLFLCTGNSCRSQMAEGLLKHLGEGRFDVYSAGVEPAAEVNPYAARVMDEIGISLDGQAPTDIEEYLGRLSAHYVIFLCESASEQCPRLWIGALTRLYWPFEDPAEFGGSVEEKTNKYREIRDAIKAKLEAWLASPDGPNKYSKDA